MPFNIFMDIIKFINSGVCIVAGQIHTFLSLKLLRIACLMVKFSILENSLDVMTQYEILGV